jgi:hypothetical protein
MRHMKIATTQLMPRPRSILLVTLALGNMKNANSLARALMTTWQHQRPIRRPLASGGSHRLVRQSSCGKASRTQVALRSTTSTVNLGANIIITILTRMKTTRMTGAIAHTNVAITPHTRMKLVAHGIRTPLVRQSLITKVLIMLGAQVWITTHLGAPLLPRTTGHGSIASTPAPPKKTSRLQTCSLQASRLQATMFCARGSRNQNVRAPSRTKVWITHHAPQKITPHRGVRSIEFIKGYGVFANVHALPQPRHQPR